MWGITIKWDVVQIFSNRKENRIPNFILRLIGKPTVADVSSRENLCGSVSRHWCSAQFGRTAVHSGSSGSLLGLDCLQSKILVCFSQYSFDNGLYVRSVCHFGYLIGGGRCAWWVTSRTVTVNTLRSCSWKLCKKQREHTDYAADTHASFAIKHYY